jgi:rubrerythrin
MSSVSGKCSDSKTLGKPYNPELSRRLEPEFRAFMERAEAIRWRPDEIPYEQIDRSLLTTADLFAVFVTLHIENYSDVYTAQLLAHHDDVPLLKQFILNWEREEENHARALERYLTELGMGLDELRASYAKVDKNDFPFPANDQAALNAFVYLQELLTRESYAKILKACREPVLCGLLKRIIRDEERHYRFYKHALGLRYKLDKKDTLSQFRHVLRTFKMPQTMYQQTAMTREMVRHRRFELSEILAIARPVFEFLEAGPHRLFKRVPRLQKLWTKRRAAFYIAQSPYVWKHALASVRLSRRIKPREALHVRATLSRLQQLLNHQ